MWQETAALRDFDPTEVGSGSILRLLPAWLLRQKFLRFLPQLPEGRNSPFVPKAEVQVALPQSQQGSNGYRIVASVC